VIHRSFSGGLKTGQITRYKFRTDTPQQHALK
jgi:hypothetical protein